MLRIKLHSKVLGALLLLALVPLILLLFNSHHSLRLVEDLLRQRTTETLDTQATKALKKRTQMVAEQISVFLKQIEGNLLDLALLPPDQEDYQEFGNNHQREIWYRGGSNTSPTEIRENIPLFSELTFVDPSGKERVRIVNGFPSEKLRVVSDPNQTTYPGEDYFLQAARLLPGQIWTTHLSGWHVSRDEQLQGTADPIEAIEGKQYEGVIRFATPVYQQGEWQGVVVLSLDHRHLMSFTQHISPIDGQDMVFPSYESGNYAFLFDDEGWMITHPKFWNIRGFDASGELVPAYTVDTPQDVIDAGRIPFNLMTAAFVHPNYPKVADLVRRGDSGVLSTINVGGSHKIMAYAPILYHNGVYQQSGVFGGVTIGAEIDLFHFPATSTAMLIQNEINNYLMQSWLVISFTVMFVAFVAYLLSNSIVRPIKLLTDGTRKMTSGKGLRVKVDVRSNDEVGELANSFNQMVEELSRRRERLLRTMQALRRSRKEIISERNFKNTLFENIETGLITFDSEERVTSANGPACRILDMPRPSDEPDWQQQLRDWPEFKNVLEGWFTKRACNRINSRPMYVSVERNGRKLTYRLALFPLSFRQEDGWLLTIEDLTERVNMRHQMARMDRLASLGRMSAGIAHEVRNPLTGVSLLLDELHDRLLGQQSDQLLIRRALEEIERLESLVSQMLRFSAAKPPKLHDGRIDGVMRDSIFLLRNQCQRQKVAIDEHIATNLPDLLLDADRIKQVILNLVNNALDAMPKGGVLKISAELLDDSILITIADNGKGIPADQLPLVFEPFFTTKGQGTGLGLSICHNIITEHGGNIQIESKPHQGTSVQIILPLNSDPIPLVG